MPTPETSLGRQPLRSGRWAAAVTQTPPKIHQLSRGFIGFEGDGAMRVSPRPTPRDPFIHQSAQTPQQNAERVM